MQALGRSAMLYLFVLGIIATLLWILRQQPEQPSIWIASSRVIDGNRDIYLQLNNSDIIRRLTTHPSADFMPIWSPDGQWIAFETERNVVDGTVLPAIYIVRPDGTELRKMGDVPGYPSERRISWSPDSQHLEVFYQPVDGAGLRFVANVYDGAWVNNVYTEASYSPAVWSPDGQWRLVPNVLDESTGERLYRQRLLGGEPELVLDMNNYLAYEWSPDGEWITFSAFVNSSREIFRVRPDGRLLDNLTNSTFDELDPFWSPNGAWIYFWRNSGQDGSLNLFRMRSDGSDPHAVTDVSGNVTDVIWSPDNEWILYIYEPLIQREWHLYRARPDGRDAQPVAEGVGSIPYVSWSPDGKTIAYSATGNVRQDIFVVNNDGSDQRQLTNDTVPEIAPFWSPDGKWVVFRRGASVLQINVEAGTSEILSDYHLAVDVGTHAHYWSPKLHEYGLIGGWTPPRPTCDVFCYLPEIALIGFISTAWMVQKRRQMNG